MKIKLVHGGPLQVGLSRRAWVNSRSIEDGTPFETILGIDAPINDFPSFVIHVESSIMVREIITSMNDHVMWARGSRVDDIIQFEVNEQLSQRQHRDVEELRSSMIDLKNQGERQDEYRLLAPVISSTSYTIRVSLRSMIKLYHYFIKLSGEMTGTAKEIFRGAATEFIAFISLVPLKGHNASKVISAYKTIDIVPALSNDSMESGQVGDFIVVSAEVPFSLRTHLIRHNSLHIKDNLIEFFSSPDIHKKTLNHKMNVQICASKGFWIKVLKERSCWMSHYGMWRQIMTALQHIIPQDESFLPCSGDGKACPFVGDAEQRVKGNDPNPPCPIYMEGNQTPASHEQVNEMSVMRMRDDRPHFWNKTINTLGEKA